MTLEYFIKELTGKSLEEITSNKRDLKTISVRHCLAYTLLKIGYSTIQVSKILKKTHATVINSRKTVENLKDTDPIIKEILSKLSDSNLSRLTQYCNDFLDIKPFHCRLIKSC